VNNVISDRAFSDLIGDIYDAALTTKWSPVLDKIIDYTGSNKAFFFLQKLNSPMPVLVEIQTNFSYPSQALLDYQTRPKDDPLYLVTKDMTQGDTLYLNEHIDIATYRHTEYYQNILLPMKSYYAIATILCRDGMFESPLAFARGEDEKPYNEKELNFIKLLAPHLSKAMHIYKELRLYKNYANLTQSILDQTDKAIIVCNEHGKIISANNYTFEALKNPSSITIHNYFIKLAEPQKQQQLLNHINQCANLSFSGIGTQQTIVVNCANQSHAMILVSSLSRNEINEFDVPCCLVTVEFEFAMNWDLVKQYAHLTAKEMQLLKAIYSKSALNDLVDKFSVSYNTLRTHLQNIFKKFGVNSQTELMVVLRSFK
jgi:DNA-binding CsgD family transcriptional regulator